MRWLNRCFTRQNITRVLFSMKDITPGNTSENYSYPSHKHLQGPINLTIRVPYVLQKQKDNLEKERIQKLLELISKP